MLSSSVYTRGPASSSPLASAIVPVPDLVVRLLFARNKSPLAAAVRYNLLSVVHKLLARDTGQAISTLLSRADEDGARPALHPGAEIILACHNGSVT